MPKKNIYNFDRNLGSIFILMLTREILRNSGEYLFKLKNLSEKSDVSPLDLDEKQEPLRKKVMAPTEKKEDYIRSIVDSELKLEQQPKTEINKEIEKPLVFKSGERFAPAPAERQAPKRIVRLRIPEPKLPKQFEYLKPTPTEREIDLGNKINSLLRNPSIREIECLGPNEELNVYGAMGRQRTDMALSREEIDRVIEKFSIASRIPTFDGVFRVVVGNLILSSMVSSQQGSRFVIRKLPPANQPPPMRRRY